MLLTLIRREITGHVLSLRFVVTFVLFFVLVLVSVLVMTHGYQARVRGYEASVSAHGAALDQIERVQDPDQRAQDLFFSKGIYGDVPPERLGIIVDGLEAQVPSQVHAVTFNPRSIDEDLYRNPLLALFTSPDYGHVVGIVVSLLALLFVFDAICGEKERGTLKLTLSNAVPRDRLILGKWIGGYLALAVPFLLSVLAGFAYLRLAGDVVLAGEDVPRLLWIVASSLLYISVFFTLGLMISALTHRSATALVIALFVWIGWTLVIPNLAPVVARLAYAVPSPEKIAAEKRAVDQETELRLQRVSQTTLSYGKEGQRMQEQIRADGEMRKGKLDRFYDDEFRAQIRLSQTLSRLSPAASFRYVTTELAQTGVSRYQDVKHASQRFRQELAKYAQDVQGGARGQSHLAPDWYHREQVPSLRVAAPRLSDTLSGVSTDLLLLGIYNVLFFMGTYVFFLRYDAT